MRDTKVDDGQLPLCRRTHPSLDTLNYHHQDLTRHYLVDLPLALFDHDLLMSTLPQAGLRASAQPSEKRFLISVPRMGTCSQTHQPEEMPQYPRSNPDHRLE
jgi:hypothetical protein